MEYRLNDDPVGGVDWYVAGQGQGRFMRLEGCSVFNRNPGGRRMIVGGPSRI